MNCSCPVEIVDTELMTIGQGMVCLTAARAALNGAGMEETVQAAREAIPEIHFMVLFDSLKYLAMGGRIGQAKNLLGALLNIKPLLGMKEGIVVPISKARSYSRGLEQQYNFIARAVEEGNLKELAIMYNTRPDAAEELATLIAPAYPHDKIIMGEIGPILGTHSGPNITAVCIRSGISV